MGGMKVCCVTIFGEDWRVPWSGMGVIAEQVLKQADLFSLVCLEKDSEHATTLWNVL